MVDSLKQQLIRDFAEARSSGLKLAVDALQGGSSAVAEKQITDWLVAWINKGPVDQRHEAVTNYLQSGFQAFIQINDQAPVITNSITTGLGAKMETLENNLKVLSRSIGPLFAGLEPEILFAISTAMEQRDATPVRTVKPGQEEAANGEQSLKLSQLMNDAIKQSGIKFNRSDSEELRIEKAEKLNTLLVATLKEHRTLFTKSFFADTKTRLAELTEDTINFIQPLSHNPDVLTAMLDTEDGGRFWNEQVEGKQINDLSNDELMTLIPENEHRALIDSVQSKLSPILQSGDKQSLEFIHEAIKQMSPQEKMVALIKAREAGDVVAVRKQTGRTSLGDFISEKTIMQFLANAALGLIIGGAAGIPGLGVLAMSFFSLLGFKKGTSEANSDLLKFAPPQPQVGAEKVAA